MSGGTLRQVKLGELLNHGQAQQVMQILNKHADPLDAVHELKQYLRQFEGQLESKGVLPDYLAYYLCHAKGQGTL